MRFDTEEGFFRAVYQKARKGPFQVAESIGGVSRDDRIKITSHIVDMMRAAFAVHEHCLTQTGPSDSLLEYRLKGAENSLPPGWRIVVMAEAGATRVDLYGPDDVRREIPGADKLPMSALVFAATSHAIACESEATQKVPHASAG